MNIEPIAIIKTDFKEKFGIPRQSGRVPAQGEIHFLPKFKNPDAVRGIKSFSHLILLFDFSQAHCKEFRPTVRPPRLGGNTRMGVFATRSPFRPNSIGLSVVRLLAVEKGPVLHVSGVDLLDNTPLYDIKPYLKSDAYPQAVGGFADEHICHRLNVQAPNGILDPLSPEKRQTLLAAIADDPRPSYQNDGRIYSMHFAEFDVRFTVSDDTAQIIELVPLV